jgi:hypothetical protein
MSSSTKPDHRTLPRKKRPPSERDQMIFLARHTHAWTQAKLAEEFHLSQPRVSAILRRVEQWRSGYGPQAAGEIDHAGRQRLERFLDRERNQGIFDRAIRGFDEAPKELTADKSGDRDGKKYSEQSRRDLPPQVQLLKVALRAAENLAKAADKPAPPPPRDPQEEQRKEEQVATHWLYRRRREAEEAGQVAKSRGHNSDNYDYMETVQHWLGALVGEQPIWRASSIHFGPGTPLAELAKFYYPDTPTEDAKAYDDSSNPTNPNESEYSQADDAASLAAESAAEKDADISRDQTWSRSAAEGVGARAQDEDRTPEPGLVPAKNKDDAAERRRRHMQKLEAWKEARRRHLPIQFEFDSADGPLPPRYYVLDGAEE